MLFCIEHPCSREECEKSGRSDKKSQNYDPQFRCRDFLNCFTLNAQKYAEPGRHLSADESMDLFTVLIVLYC